MDTLIFESVHQRLVDIPEKPLFHFLNKSENFYLKKKVTYLIFKSYHFLSKRCNNGLEWSQKVTFFQSLHLFINYLEYLEESQI